MINALQKHLISKASRKTVHLFYLGNNTLAYVSVFCDRHVPLLPGYYVILIVTLGGLCHPSHKSTKKH